MTSAYVPSSNWSHRPLKGRDLSSRPLRPLEPVSFKSDDAPVAGAEAAGAPDGVMDQIQARLDDTAAQTRGPLHRANAVEIMDLPMDAIAAKPLADVVMEAPLEPDELDMAASDAVMEAQIAQRPNAEARSEVRPLDAVVPESVWATPTAPERSESGSTGRGGIDKRWLIAAPAGIAALAVVGYFVLSSNATTPTVIEPAATTQGLRSTQEPMPEALVGMPVTDAASVSVSDPSAPAAAGRAPAQAAASTSARAPSIPARVEATEPPVAIQSATGTPEAAPVAPDTPEPAVIRPVAVEPVTPPGSAPLIEPEPLVVP